MSGEFTQDFFTSRRNYDDGNTRIGELDRLWYDSNTNTIRIGDGITPGGIIVSGGGGIGVSGFSGKSGYSGSTGLSGYSGLGLSGYSGATGLSGFSGAAGTGVNPWIKKTSFYTAVSGDRIIADTSGGSFTIDLPATPVLGYYVVITDGANFRQNNLIVGRNGSTIEGLPDDVALDMQGVTFEFIYSGTTWQVTATTGQSGTSGYSGALDPWKLITSTYYAVNGNRLIGDTSSGSFTVYLPATAVDGDYVQITDGDNFAINNLFVDPNGGTIEGLNDIVALDMKGVTYEFIYSVNTWDVTATTGASGTSGFSGLGLSGFSGFSGSGGSTITINNDESTNNTYYPLWATSDSGTISTIYTASSKLTFNPSTGTLSATEINSLSDISLKENIKPIINPMEVLNSISGVQFDWKNSNKSSLGVIAQYIEKELPMLVNNVNGLKTVNYNGLISLLIEAYKELYKKIEMLEKQNPK